LKEGNEGLQRSSQIIRQNTYTAACISWSISVRPILKFELSYWWLLADILWTRLDWLQGHSWSSWSMYCMRYVDWKRFKWTSSNLVWWWWCIHCGVRWSRCHFGRGRISAHWCGKMPRITLDMEFVRNLCLLQSIRAVHIIAVNGGPRI
jgi:hypothetical protein